METSIYELVAREMHRFQARTGCTIEGMIMHPETVAALQHSIASANFSFLLEGTYCPTEFYAGVPIYKSINIAPGQVKIF